MSSRGFGKKFLLARESGSSFLRNVSWGVFLWEVFGDVVWEFFKEIFWGMFFGWGKIWGLGGKFIGGGFGVEVF